MKIRDKINELVLGQKKRIEKQAAAAKLAKEAIGPALFDVHQIKIDDVAGILGEPVPGFLVVKEFHSGYSIEIERPGKAEKESFIRILCHGPQAYEITQWTSYKETVFAHKACNANDTLDHVATIIADRRMESDLYELP